MIIIDAATADDVKTADVLGQYPSLPTRAGGGLHAIIPGDWQARIDRGEDVAGITKGYAVSADGALYIKDEDAANADHPAIVAKLASLGAKADTVLIAIDAAIAETLPVGKVVGK